MANIYAFIKNIVVYILLINIIMNLLGDSSYKKYIKIFTGMLLILLLVTPLANYLKTANLFDYYYEKNKFNIELEDVSGNLLDVEKKQKKIISEEYEKELENQIKEILLQEHLYLKSINFEIITKDDESFGRIKSMDIVASRKVIGINDYEDIKDIKINPIKKVDIVDEDNNELLSIEEKRINTYKEKMDHKKITSDTLEIGNIKEKLSEIYRINTDYIKILIQE